LTFHLAVAIVPTILYYSLTGINVSTVAVIVLSVWAVRS